MSEEFCPTCGLLDDDQFLCRKDDCWAKRPKRADLAAERDRLAEALTKQNEEISQTLGKALGYPWFKDDPKNFPDSTEEHGVCVGDHVAETLAGEAAAKIIRLAERVKALEDGLGAIKWIVEAGNGNHEGRLARIGDRVREVFPTQEVER